MNLEAKKIALDYLNTYKEDYSTIKMDPMMVPFKQLFTKYGYITLHSCSGHVKTSLVMKPTDINGDLVTRARTHKRNRWYILFVAVKDISVIKNAIERINQKYNYKIELESKPKHPHAKEVWIMDYTIDKNYNYQELYEINKNIYKEFEKEFKNQFKKQKEAI